MQRRLSNVVVMGPHVVACSSYRDAAGLVVHVDVRGLSLQGAPDPLETAKSVFHLLEAVAPARWEPAQVADRRHEKRGGSSACAEDTTHAATGGGMGPGTIGAVAGASPR